MDDDDEYTYSDEEMDDDDSDDDYTHDDDLKRLTIKLNEQESIMRLKRRWLMNLPLSAAEEEQVEQMLSANTTLPESLLRDDDVSSEIMKNCIERGFGVDKPGKAHRGDQEQIFQSADDCKDIYSLRDSMTNIGLYSFCKTLTGGTVEFEKTKPRMRETIRKQLRKITSRKSDISDTLLEQLSELVYDPNNFLKSQWVGSTSPEAYRDAAENVLDELKDKGFTTQILRAMLRKLSGEIVINPDLKKKELIELIKEGCKDMIKELSEGRGPAEKLASALGVASLALKHLLNRPVAVNFRNFSPKVEALQNNIAKTIWLLNQPNIVGEKELSRLKAELPNTRNKPCYELTEYLFECADMPDSLIDALDIINNGKILVQPWRKKLRLSPQDVMKDEMQKEIECVLSLSAKAKQVLLDALQHEFDEDYARAYMENYDESDTSVSDDEDEDDWMIGNSSIHSKFDYHNSHNETESVGETTPPMPSSPVSTSHTDCHSPAHSHNSSLNTPLGSRSIDEMDLDEIQSHKEPEVQSGQNMKRKYKSTTKIEMDSLSPHNAASMRNSAPPSFAMDSSTVECRTEEFNLEQTKVDESLQSGSSNAYLEIQEACDATSMIAYRFVGQKLQRLAGPKLSQGDRLYLQSGASIPESSEESLESLSTSKLTGMWKDMLDC